MNILSLFDGMSCGQIALNRLGVKIDNYFASEIDKNAINITQVNYPDTKQIGDVTKIDGNLLPRIDLLIGGSPCTNFSFAGKKYGMVTEENNIEVFDLDTYLKLKKDGFTFKGQSFLFWEYIRLFNEVKPKYFLLENVLMDKKWENIISNTLGVKPILINSNLVSAQNRKRLYWTNIPNITQPVNKGIKLQDVLENGLTDREKAYCLTLHVGTLRDYFKKNETNIVYLPDDNGKYEVINSKISMSFPKGKDPNQVFTFNVKVPDGRYNFRKLTLSELERLQTVPDGYTQCVGYTNGMKALGNGWTVDVIAHILSFFKK